MIWVGKNSPVAWLRFVVPVSEPAVGHDGAEGSEPLPQWASRRETELFHHTRLRRFLCSARRRGVSTSFVPGLKPSYGLPSRDPGFSLLNSLPEPSRGSLVTSVFRAKPMSKSISISKRASVSARARGWAILSTVSSTAILLAMVLYSFFLLLSLKDRAYLYYIFYIVSAGLWLFFVQGQAKLVFGQIPNFDQAMLWFWAGSMITWGAVFTAVFLRMKEGQPFLSPYVHRHGDLWRRGVRSRASLAGTTWRFPCPTISD